MRKILSILLGLFSLFSLFSYAPSAAANKWYDRQIWKAPAGDKSLYWDYQFEGNDWDSYGNICTLDRTIIMSSVRYSSIRTFPKSFIAEGKLGTEYRTTWRRYDRKWSEGRAYDQWFLETTGKRRLWHGDELVWKKAVIKIWFTGTGDAAFDEGFFIDGSFTISTSLLLYRFKTVRGAIGIDYMGACDKNGKLKR